MISATFLVPYPAGSAPGQRFRFEQWLSLLPADAIDVRLEPLFTEEVFRNLYREGATAAKVVATLRGGFERLPAVRRALRSDVVFLYREAFPLGPPLLEDWLARRVPLVYDFDDAIFLGDTSSANRIASRLKRPTKVRDITAVATVTTVGNRFLAEWANRYASRVEVIPTTVRTDVYRPPAGPRRPGPIRVGWSGSPSTARHLLGVRAALLRAVEELGIELWVYGAPSIELPRHERVRILPWTRETEIPVVSSFDIGLMPLPDDLWARGKCGFKALLYQSLGVPAVVSPVGVNRDVVRHGETGLWAATDEEWFLAIQRLAEDPVERSRLGAAGREHVVAEYSGRRWAPVFHRVLVDAARS